MPSQSTGDRLCRICLDLEPEQDLFSPCKCKGTMKWVHHSCLNSWWHTLVINKKLQGKEFHCQTCRYEYKFEQKFFSRICSQRNAELSVIFIIMAIFCFGILFDKLDPLHSSIKSITPLRKFIAQDEVTFSLVRKTWLSTTKTQQITSFSNLFILMFSNFIYGTPLKFSSVVKFLSEQFGQYFIVFVNGTILLVLFSKLFKKNESDSKLFYITHLISYALTGDLIPFTILNAFNLTFELFLTNFKLVVTISILVFKNELKRKSLHSKILIENRADTLPELLEEQGNTDNIASKKDDLVLMFFKFFFKSFIVCLKYYWSLLLIYYLVQVYNDLRKLVNHVGFKYPIGIKSYSDAV